MQVAIRAEASERIGSGHLVRCLVLADALAANGANVHFLCRELPQAFAEEIARRGHALLRLEPVDEVDAARRALAPLGAVDWLVVDHYGLGVDWERGMRCWAGNLMAIDDLGREHDADLLLDQNLVAPGERRYAGRVPDGCRLLLGEDYVLLGAAFLKHADTRAPRRGRVRRILVFFGGGEHDALALAFLDAFAGIDDAGVHVDLVLPTVGARVAELEARLAADPRVLRHGRLPDLASLVAGADLALGAAGSASWERLYLGLPSLVASLAENQRAVASELARRGLAMWVGEGRIPDASALRAALREALAIPELEPWSRRCLAVVDGHGAARVIGTMRELRAQAPRARAVVAADEAQLLAWANDPGTRQQSFNPAQIAPEEHHAWLQRRLADPGCRFYVVEVGGRGIGTVRFQHGTEGWEVHFALAPEARGRGYGARLVRAGLDALRAANIEGESRVFGRVQDGNLPSRKVFEALAFSRDEAAQAGVLVFRSRL